MQLKILADESVNLNIVKHLRNLNFQVHSVSEEKKGVSDFTVLEYSLELEAILITEDKDFGEWIFAHHAKSLGVILLRYQADELQKINDSLTTLLKEHGELMFGKFVVIKKNKFRIREL